MRDCEDFCVLALVTSDLRSTDVIESQQHDYEGHVFLFPRAVRFGFGNSFALVIPLPSVFCVNVVKQILTNHNDVSRGGLNICYAVVERSAA